MVPMMPHAKQTVCDYQYAIGAIGQLWCSGLELDFQKFFPDPKSRRRVHLPTYSFDRQKHWFEVGPTRETLENIASEEQAMLERSAPRTVGDSAENGSENGEDAIVEKSPLTTASSGSSELAVLLVQQQMEIMQKQLYLIEKSRGE